MESTATSGVLTRWAAGTKVLVKSLGVYMIPTSLIVVWALFVIEEVGHVIEDPFNIHMVIAGSGQVRCPLSCSLPRDSLHLPSS